MEATSKPRAPAGLLVRAGHLVGLLLLVGLTLWGNACWVDQNLQPPLDDDNSHLMTAVDMTRTVAAASSAPAALDAMYWWPSHYPPGAYWVSVAVMRCAGTSVRAAVHSLAVYAALLIVSCFATGLALGGPRAAWLSALVAATCPLVLQFSRVYFLDMPETALVAASLAALCCSRDLRSAPMTVLAGLAAGMALLVKSPAVVLVFIPFVTMALAWLVTDREAWTPFALTLTLVGGVAWGALRLAGLLADDPGDAVHATVLRVALAAGALLVAAGIGLRRTHRPAWTAAGNGLWAAAAACTLAAPWYVVNLQAVRTKLAVQDLAFTHGFSQAEAAGLAAMDLACMFWLSGPLVVVGLLHALHHPRRTPSPVWASAAALAAMVAWIHVSGWSSRYVLPVLPFVIVLSTWWLDAVPRVVARVLLPYLVAGMTWQAAGSWIMDAGVAPGMPRFDPGGPRWSLLPLTTLPPEREGFPVDDVLAAIPADRRGRPLTVGVMQMTTDKTHRPLDARALEMVDHLDPRNLRFKSLDAEGQEPRDPGHRGERHPACDYLVVSFCPPPADDAWMTTLADKQGWRLEPVLARTLPHGLDMRLYRVRRP